jgi:hypothetical protein
VEDAKQLHAQLQDAEKKLTVMKDEHEKSLKAKNTELSAALGAIEQMHTVVCQPQVGIVQGIGITLEEADVGARGDWERPGHDGCKVESIIRNGVAESEGTLRCGDIIQEVDGQDVKGCLFEDIHGLLIGVAGSSVTICGLHPPYTPADEYSAVLVRSGFNCSPAHAILTLQVEDLTQQVWLPIPTHPCLAQPARRSHEQRKLTCHP